MKKVKNSRRNRPKVAKTSDMVIKHGLTFNRIVLYNISNGKIFLLSMGIIFRRGGVEVERSPRMREIGVRFPLAIDSTTANAWQQV